MQEGERLDRNERIEGSYFENGTFDDGYNSYSQKNMSKAERRADNAARYNDAEDIEFSDVEDVSDYYLSDVYPKGFRKQTYAEIRKQGVPRPLPEMPELKADNAMRRRIAKARVSRPALPEREYKLWRRALGSKLEKVARKGKTAKFQNKMKQQSVEIGKIFPSVFKIYRDDVYVCTGTLIGNRMFVVLHALSEDMTTKYKAVNYVHQIELKASTLEAHSMEIGSFAVNGIAAPLKKNSMRIPDKGELMCVVGFGAGSETYPALKLGFGSPKGWMDADTVAGDCSSPVLNKEQRVVGFWTHGNGLTNGNEFGRFEPVNQAMIDVVGATPIVHQGLDFQSHLQLQKSL